MQPAYNPQELADRIEALSPHEAHAFWRAVAAPGTRLGSEYATALLSVARGLRAWHQIMCVLMIGNFYFDDEFVDYAIDMLTFPPSGTPSKEELWQHLNKGEDPWAVSLWAYNLLISRARIRPDQYRRIVRLPDGTFGKQSLVEALKERVR